MRWVWGLRWEGAPEIYGLSVNAINVAIAVWISPNTVQFVIGFTGIFLYCHYWIHIVIPRGIQHKYAYLNTYLLSGIQDKQQKYASNANTQDLRCGFGGFWRSVGVVILPDFHGFFLGYEMSIVVEIQSPLQRWGLLQYAKFDHDPWMVVNTGPFNKCYKFC